MPIDPSIPASAFANRPMSGLGDMYEQQRTRAQTDEIQARTRLLTQQEAQKRLEADEATARNAKLEAIWREWGGKDVKRAVSLTYSVDPDAAAKIDEQIAKSANQWAQEAAHHEKTEGERIGRYASMFQGATTPELLSQVKQRFAQEDPENAQMFASITDPRDPALPALILMGMQAKDIHAARAKALEFIQKGQGEGTFAQGIAQVLSATPKDFWDDVLTGAGPLLGEAQAQAMAAMTPEQMQTLAIGQKDVAAQRVQTRGQDVAAATARRGQDVSAATAKRGQDVSAATARRGQDLGGGTGGAAGKSGAGWSPKLDPDMMNAADSAILMIPGTRRPPVVAMINRLAEAGNTDELKRVVRQAAVEGEPVDTRRQIEGRGNAAAAIADIKSSLQELKAAGVDTNILRGSAEDVARKLGTSTDTRLATLGVQIEDALIEYRRSMTGVQFSDREAAEYRTLFPNYTNTLPLNLAVLDGLGKAFGTRDKVYWERKLGPSGAVLVGALQPKTPPPAPAPVNAAPIGGSSAFEVVAPNGKTYAFKSQAEVEAFKKKVGMR